MKKKQIIASLFVIGIISLLMKLYFVDFSTYIVSDTTSYALNAFSYINNDFTPIQNKNPGWPIFISIFFQLFESESFIEYGNIIRILSISIATLTILPVYLLARKWFPQKYSIVAASFFAFEPHLNYHAGWGFSEPLYIIFWVIAFYFISSSKYKFIFLAFVCAGLIWWIRWPGAIMFVILSVIYFINLRHIQNAYVKYFGCLGIFMIIIAPILLQRYEEFGNPLHYGISSQMFVGDFALLQSNIINKSYETYTILDSIRDNGFFGFVNKFVFVGTINLFSVFIKNLFPYLIILFPIGIILSIREEKNRKNVRANGILILITLVSMVVSFSVVQDKRFLYNLIPFIILFSIIPVQRIVENGFNVISISKKQKDYLLIILVILILILSLFFMQRYDSRDEVEFEEKTKFAQHMLDNFEGVMVDAGQTTSGVRYLKLENPPEAFKTYQNSNHNFPQETMLKEGYLVPFANDDKLVLVAVYAKTLDEFIQVAQEYGIKYVAVREEGPTMQLYPYLDQIYHNESNYEFFEKVFDSKVMKYEKLHVKVFEINFEKFYNLKD